MPMDKQLHGMLHLLESPQQTDGTFKLSNLKGDIYEGVGRV